jgi:hypothetical protein
VKPEVLDEQVKRDLQNGPRTPASIAREWPSKAQGSR